MCLCIFPWVFNISEIRMGLIIYVYAKYRPSDSPKAISMLLLKKNSTYTNTKSLRTYYCKCSKWKSSGIWINIRKKISSDVYNVLEKHIISPSNPWLYKQYYSGGKWLNFKKLIEREMLSKMWSSGIWIRTKPWNNFWNHEAIKVDRNNWTRAGIFAEWIGLGLDPIQPFLAQSHLRSITCIFKMAAGVKGYTMCGQGAEKTQLSLVTILCQSSLTSAVRANPYNPRKTLFKTLQCGSSLL